MIFKNEELKDHDPRKSLGADLHLEIEDEKCSLWWNDVPDWPNEKLGVIGNYHASNSEKTHSLLQNACDILKEKNCTKAIGPMNGNTWQSYRFVTYSNSRPAFLLEPHQPYHWPSYWENTGFESWQKYCSLVQTLSNDDPRAEKALLRLQQKGITIRNIKIDQFEHELKAVYEICLEAFKDNILYTPVSEQTYLSKYLPFANKVDPNYILIAEDNGTCCGFIFAIPDYQQLQSQTKIDTIILKTLAIQPSRKYAGLGVGLVHLVQQKAKQNGFTHAIHALMHNNNSSANIGKEADKFREYTLFSKNL